MTANPHLPPYPTGRLLSGIGIAAVVLLGLWTGVFYAGDLEVDI